MSYLTWQRLALAGLITVVPSWLITVAMERNGATPERVPWTMIVVCIVAGGFALWAGWQVRSYLKGDRPSLDALRAARTAVYAQACAYGGAILVGAFGGYGLGLIDQWSHEPRREVILSALFGALAGAALMIAGAVAERWCRHSDDGDHGERSEATTA